MKNNLTIFDVADWFLHKESMTNKKLQKLCWYAYSWFIYLNNENPKRISNRLFEENFRAWIHGPVNNELYNKHKSNGYFEIPKLNKLNGEKYLGYTEFLEKIYNIYGNFDGDELEAQSHSEIPWINARKGLKAWETSQNIINDYDIFMEYSNR